jgi:hypothetical protein
VSEKGKRDQAAPLSRSHVLTRNARNGETPDPNTRTALQLEAVEPHTIAIIAIFLVERYIGVKQYISLQISDWSVDCLAVS